LRGSNRVCSNGGGCLLAAAERAERVGTGDGPGELVHHRVVDGQRRAGDDGQGQAVGQELAGSGRKATSSAFQLGGRFGCRRISVSETISSTEPKMTRAYRTPVSLNELPMPTRNNTAARKTVIRT
jgi:hypothetical protein